MDEILREQAVQPAPMQADKMAAQPVDTLRLREFDRRLLEYKAGKAKLEKRVIAAENWWRLRNAEEAIKADAIEPDSGFRAKSGWLHNVIVAKHADAMDNYPEPVVLPREPGDEEQARMLSKVLPVILDQVGFKRTYWDCWWQKLKTGTGVYKVTWNPDAQNGLGDIDIKRVDLLHLFWQPGITDIQDSRYLFHAELRDNEVLEEEYPQLKGKLGDHRAIIEQFKTDDHVPTEHKSLVVDVYYKKGGALHYCKYVGDEILASTENEGTTLYDHGKYPFVFDALWPVEGSPAGYGFVDLCSNPQIYLDMLDTAFLKNTMVGATPRYFQRGDSGINEAEFMDLRKPIVHVAGSSVDDSQVRVIDYRPLGGTYINVYEGKIAELRETSGNTETANGVTGGGVTAASAIAALQEASGKTSRDATGAGYMSFADIVILCIEMVRQFYSLPRTFRITGEQGEPEFVQMSNQGMKETPIYLGNVELGMRLPVYDIHVEVQKKNAYTRTAQNELALQFYNLGFFAPQMATPALTCLDMMDFDGKEDLMRKIQMNGTIYDQLMQAQQMVMTLLQKYEPELVPQMAAAMGMENVPNPEIGAAQAMPQDINMESGTTAKARARANRATEANA